MRATRIRYEWAAVAVAAAAIVGVFAMAYATMGATPAAERPPGFYRDLAIVWVVVAAPSVVAALLLVRAWWARSGAVVSASDGPARLLAAAAGTAPERRREWAAAMAAELAEVRGSAARWRFAAGCALAAVFPPRSSRFPILVVAAVAVLSAVSAGVAAGYALPGLGLFAVTFTALVGGIATAAVARARTLRRSVPGWALAALGAVGVAGCVVATAYYSVTYPSVAHALAPVHALVFAAVLAACLWLALLPPRALTTSRFAVAAGLVGAAVLAASLLRYSRFPDGHTGGAWNVVLLAPLVYVVVSVLVAAVRRSFRAGVQATVWTTVAGALTLFVLWLAEAVRWHQLGAGMLLDADNAPMGANVKDAVFWVLVFLPVWGAPFGVIGAALGGARFWRRLAHVPVGPG
jgi:hypothetical protein